MRLNIRLKRWGMPSRRFGLWLLLLWRAWRGLVLVRRRSLPAGRRPGRRAVVLQLPQALWCRDCWRPRRGAGRAMATEFPRDSGMVRPVGATGRSRLAPVVDRAERWRKDGRRTAGSASSSGQRAWRASGVSPNNCEEAPAVKPCCGLWLRPPRPGCGCVGSRRQGCSGWAGSFCIGRSYASAPGPRRAASEELAVWGALVLLAAATVPETPTAILAGCLQGGGGGPARLHLVCD